MLKNNIVTVLLLTVFSVQIGFSQSEDKTDISYQLYLTRIAAAEAFLQLNKISTAKEYLNACEVKHRNVEWSFLNKALEQSEHSTAKPEGSYFTDIKMSPNGKLVAVASSDSLITLHDYPGLVMKMELRGHKASVSTIAFSEDGKKLVSGGRDHSVIIWDVETGKQLIKNDQSFTQGIYQVTFSPNGSWVGVVSWERLRDRKPFIFGFAKILDANDGHEIKRIETDNHPAAGIVFLPDNKTIIVSTWGEIVYSYNTETAAINWKYDVSEPSEYNAFHSIDISPDGKTIAVGSADHRVYVINTENGNVLHWIESWKGHTKIVKAVKFSSDGKYLATAGEDQTILVWKTEDYTKTTALIGHVNTVNGLIWANDGKAILSSSMDGTRKEWNLERPFERSYTICDFGPWQTPVTPDGKYFLAPCSDKKMIMYDAATGTQRVSFGEQSGLCADISKDSKLAVTSSFDGVVRLWDVVNGKEQAVLSGHTGRVDGICYMNTRQYIVSVGDTTLRVWDIRSQKEIQTIPLNDTPFRVTVTPDESKVIVACNSGKILFIETSSWSETASVMCEKSIQEMSVNSDGTTLAVSSGLDIELWNIKTTTRIAQLKGHEKNVNDIDFSADGKYLISGSNDQTFKLWNLEKLTCTLTSHAYEDVIYTSKFLSSNEIFLSSTQGKIWYYRY